MKLCCFVFILLFSNYVEAGGSSWPVKMMEEPSASEPYVIKLALVGENFYAKSDIGDCQTMTVYVQQAKRSLWSYLPFNNTYEQIKRETDASIAFMRYQFKKNDSFSFGAWGGFLKSKLCIFSSRGLQIYWDNDTESHYVMSRSDS